jgi:hypothetical protein
VKFKVVLKRMLSNHNNLRTDVIEGMAMHLPSVGMPFILFGESLTDPAATRVVTTTPVMETKVLVVRTNLIEKENTLLNLRTEKIELNI